jgi:hypothetical protein
MRMVVTVISRMYCLCCETLQTSRAYSVDLNSLVKQRTDETEHATFNTELADLQRKMDDIGPSISRLSARLRRFGKANRENSAGDG